MILADKIIQLRKKAGWSQEELARELGVSRQAISKWEGAQSIPDISRILEMGEVFGVSTDFLLKDELDMSDLETLPDVESEAVLGSSGESLCRVSLEEATQFLDLRIRYSRVYGLGVFLCVLGVALMVLFGGLLPEAPHPPLPETLGLAIGMGCLFLFTGVGAALLIHGGYLEKPFEEWKKQPLETAYGVDGMARSRREAIRPGYVAKMIAGAILIVLAVFLFVIGGIMDDTQPPRPEGGVFLALAVLVPLGLGIIGVGASLLISGGVVMEAVNILLQEGEYTVNLKRAHRVTVSVTLAYWAVVAAIFLGYSLTTQNWGISWVILPVAALLYAALATVLHAILARKSPK